MKNARPDRETFTAFLVLVLIGDGNAVTVRFTVLELDPFWAAAFRFLCASIVFSALMLARRIPMPGGRDPFGDVLYGLLFFGAKAGVTLSSSSQATAPPPHPRSHLMWAESKPLSPS